MQMLKQKIDGSLRKMTSLKQKLWHAKSSDLELALLQGGGTDQKHPVRKIKNVRKVSAVSIHPQNLVINVPVETTQPQNIDDGENSGANPQNIENKSDLDEWLIKFGPCHGKDMQEMSDCKTRALEHVLVRTWPDNTVLAREYYMAAIRKVSAKARNLYADEIQYSDYEFKEMMMKDGCLFLQLALLILGGSEQLEYKTEDLKYVFGIGPDEKELSMRRWLESMFFVGNQIPLVVLKELMSQKFFQDAIGKGKWNAPPQSALSKRVLYELLVLPARHSITKRPEDWPCDLLHCLHILVMGPAPPRKTTPSFVYESHNNFFDLEANQHSINGATSHAGEPSRPNNHVPIFPCATDLDELGVGIKRLKSGGARSINFTNHYFWATLHLPVLPIDEDFEMTFRNLKIYEDNQQPEMNKTNKGELNSYLLFLRDLIQTSNDVNFLQSKGIIEGSSDDLDELPKLLGNLSDEKVPLTQGFRKLRRNLRGYTGPPWAKLEIILYLVAILTLVQTVFSVLAFFYR